MPWTTHLGMLHTTYLGDGLFLFQAHELFFSQNGVATLGVLRGSGLFVGGGLIHVRQIWWPVQHTSSVIFRFRRKSRAKRWLGDLLFRFASALCSFCALCWALSISCGRRGTFGTFWGLPHVVVGGGFRASCTQTTSWQAWHVVCTLLLNVGACVGQNAWGSKDGVLDGVTVCLTLWFGSGYSSRGCLGLWGGCPTSGLGCLGWPAWCSEAATSR